MSIMMFRVSSGEKSASPRRALVAAALLLGVSCALAASMSWGSAADRLGESFEPPGWHVSFSPPKGFLMVDQTSTPTGFEWLFRGEGFDGRPLVLIFRGVAPDELASNPGDSSPEEFGESAMFTRAFSFRVVSQLPKSSQTGIGPLPGAEVPNLDGGTIVRAVVTDDGVRYAVVLSSGGRPIDRRIYELFHLVCTSVRYLAH